MRQVDRLDGLCYCTGNIAIRLMGQGEMNMEGEQEKGARDDALRFLADQQRMIEERIKWTEVYLWDCQRRIAWRRPRIWEIRAWCHRLQDHHLVRKLKRDRTVLTMDDLRLRVATTAAEKGDFRETIEILDLWVGEMTLRSQDDLDGAPSSITLAQEFRRLKMRLMTLPPQPA